MMDKWVGQTGAHVGEGERSIFPPPPVDRCWAFSGFITNRGTIFLCVCLRFVIEHMSQEKK